MHTSRPLPVSGFIALVALLTGFVAPARAQDFPAHPVRLISDSAAGSAIDVTVRIVAEGLSRIWGQQAVVVNQPGAGGAIAARSVTSAANDGYSLGVLALSAFVAAPGSADNLPVQVPRDVVPVAHLGGAPMFISAGGWLGVQTLPQLIALAKQKPGELSYGVNGIGRLTHLTGELLANQAGIKLLVVPYTGGTPAILNDIMGKRVALIFEAYSGIAGAIEAHTIVPLAVASAHRLPDLPDLPTAAETLPGYEAMSWQVLVAPPGTPDAIVQKINADVIKAMSDPNIRKKLADLGREDRPLPPAQLLAFIHNEQKKWAPIVQEIADQTTQNK